MAYLLPQLLARQLSSPAARACRQKPWQLPSADKDIVVGFIYVGPKDDFGYDQAHAEGARVMGDLPGINIVEEASVPETPAITETIRSMI